MSFHSQLSEGHRMKYVEAGVSVISKTFDIVREDGYDEFKRNTVDSLYSAFSVLLSTGYSFSYTYLTYFKRKAVEIIDHAAPKDECSRHLKAWIGDLFNLKKVWALQMLDASAKPQSGFLLGNIFHFGNYDECLAIREDKGEDGVIEGQYCTVALTPAHNTTSDLGQILDFATSITEILGVQEGKDLKHILRLVKMIYGICLPKACGAESIQKLWNYLEYSFRIPIHVSVGDDFCTHKGKVPHVFEFDIVVFWIFGLYFTFICFASVYELIFIGKDVGDNSWDCILIAFSLRKNAKKILDTESKPHEDATFSCLDGLKSISMLWVIFGHKYLVGFVSGTVNMLQYFEYRKSLSALILLLGPFSVDTFLVISGLLLAYKYMQVRDMLPPGAPFPYFMFYFMRLLRLWPCLIATIFVYANVLKYLNEGPLWPLATYKLALSCKYTGWVTALFATNFINFHFQCLEPTWYLAVDTQLFCIAPLLLYFLHKHPKRSTLALISLSFTSASYAYYITVKNQERWTPSEGDDFFHSRIYQSSFVRMPVWIFGLLSGTVLYNFQKIRLHKVIVTFTWILISALLLGVVIANHVLIRQPYDEYDAAVFNAIARPAWGIAICLVIILCATDHGGVANDFLSLKAFRPLVKISYSVFLVHSGVIMVLQGGKRSPTFHDTFTTFYGYLGDMPFILITSFLWCLAFESPFINIGKLLIQGKIRPDNKIALRSEGKDKRFPQHQSEGLNRKKLS